MWRKKECYDLNALSLLLFSGLESQPKMAGQQLFIDGGDHDENTLQVYSYLHIPFKDAHSLTWAVMARVPLERTTP